MSVANGQKDVLERCVETYFPSNPPIKTVVDIHETGDIPRLLSLPQMQNLGFELKLAPAGVSLTCPSWGTTRRFLQ
eukprot:12131494-Prorocentrum_lima.AAC.1